MYEELAILLKSAFRGLPLSMEFTADGWDRLLLLAQEHNIETLIYPKVKEYLANREDLEEVLQKWRAHVYGTHIEMVSTMSTVAPLLRLCNDDGLVLMGLKGIYLRTLYSSPDFRTMGDVDFLIQEKDRMPVYSHIVGLGYELAASESNADVDVYDHKTGIRLEVHKHLPEMKSHHDQGNLECDLWQSASEHRLPEGKIWIPSHQMHVIYLLRHMARHFVEIGFGLRQIVDLALMLEKNGLDMLKILELAKQYGLGQFFICMLNLCNMILDMRIPEELEFKTDESISRLDVLKQEVLRGGVFGDAEGSKIPKILSMILHEKDKLTSVRNESRLDRTVRLLFPQPGQLSSRYSYVRKCILLLPFAWIHRWIMNIFTSHIKLSDKIGVLTISPEYELKKSSLQEWMDIS
jgi:hypothetical protein